MSRKGVYFIGCDLYFLLGREGSSWSMERDAA